MARAGSNPESRTRVDANPSTVFVDASPLSSRHLTGIGRYTARLAMVLHQVTGGRVRFFTQGEEILPADSLDWSPDQSLGPWAREVWRGRRMPLVQDSIPLNSMGLYCCLRPKKRRFPFEVSVLHDFTPLIVPWTHTMKTRVEFSRYFAVDLLSSDAAIADSAATKSNARWLCDFDPEKIIVSSPGPSLCVERHQARGPISRRPEVGLVVSTLEPRKNPYFLLDWFRETSALPSGTELWWVGPVGWLTSLRKLKRYERLADGRRVRFLGVVSDAALCRLYQTAGWTAYPSLYEGFGFPVVDSLRHGAPVLSAYHSSLCEFDIPGVFFFDPYDPATVDVAWRDLQEAGGAASVVPKAVLDGRYRWDTLARAVLGLRTDQASDSLAA